MKTEIKIEIKNGIEDVRATIYLTDKQIKKSDWNKKIKELLATVGVFI